MAAALVLALCVAPGVRAGDPAQARYLAAKALYEEGKVREALAVFAALYEDHRVQVHLEYWMAVCHYRLGHCQEGARYERAWPQRAQPDLLARLAVARADCTWQELAPVLAACECTTVEPRLVALEGRLPPPREPERERALLACREIGKARELRAFDPLAARLHYQAAVAAEGWPCLRRDLADLELRSGSCSGAAQALEGIPLDARTAVDAERLRVCTLYPPEEGTASPDKVERVAAALRALAAGDRGAARERLEPLVPTAPPSLWAVYADLVYALDGCPGWRMLWDATPAARRVAARDGAARSVACPPPEDPVRRGELAASAATASDGRAKAGTALVVVGSVLAAGGVVAAGVYGAYRPQMNEKTYLSMGLGIGAGALAAVSLAVGVILLVQDGAAGPPGFSVTLGASPGGVVVSGGF